MKRKWLVYIGSAVVGSAATVIGLISLARYAEAAEADSFDGEDCHINRYGVELTD